MEIPKFQTLAGNWYPIGSFRGDDRQVCLTNVTVEEIREYAKALEDAGFTRYAAREISAGSAYPYNVNLFYAYTREDVQVFVFWNASIHTVHITYMPPQALPNTQPIAIEDTDTFRPSLTQFPVSGMCYAVQLADGAFILVDGGLQNDEQEERLYAFLQEKSKGQKPVIATWFFTHPDSDHICLAASFLKKYAKEVEVQAFAYQFPDVDKINELPLTAIVQKDIACLERNIQTYYPRAKRYTLHTGQVFAYKGLEIEVLWSMETTYPCVYTSFNDHSAAFKCTFTNGKTAILLGDCMHESCRKIARTYGDSIKADILQVTHHGLIGGDKELYALIDPAICLWSTNRERFLGETPNQKYQWCLGEGGCDYNRFLRDDSIRQRTHYTHGEIVTLYMDE